MVRISATPPSRAVRLASVTNVMGVKVIPRAARVYIGCALLGAGVCALPALRPGAATPWSTVALLAALYALCELPARGMTFTPITPVTLASWAAREAVLRPIRTIG